MKRIFRIIFAHEFGIIKIKENLNMNFKGSKIDLYNRLKKVIYEMAESGDKYCRKFGRIYEDYIQEIICIYSIEDNLKYIPTNAINDFNFLKKVYEKVFDSIPLNIADEKLHPIRLVWSNTHQIKIKKVIKSIERIKDSLVEDIINCNQDR